MHRRRGGMSVVVGLMLLLWLGVFASAASPELHELLHSDAQSAAHHCLITQLQQHSVLDDFVPVAVPAAPPTEAGLVCATDQQLRPLCDYRLSPSRAPPSFIPTTTVAG